MELVKFRNLIDPHDSAVKSASSDAYWTGPFEDDITEMGIRAAAWGVEENEGGYSADVMLEEWAIHGFYRF